MPVVEKLQTSTGLRGTNRVVSRSTFMTSDDSKSDELRKRAARYRQYAAVHVSNNHMKAEILRFADELDAHAAELDPYRAERR